MRQKCPPCTLHNTQNSNNPFIAKSCLQFIYVMKKLMRNPYALLELKYAVETVVAEGRNSD